MTSCIFAGPNEAMHYVRNMFNAYFVHLQTFRFKIDGRRNVNMTFIRLCGVRMYHFVNCHDDFQTTCNSGTVNQMYLAKHHDV